MPKKAWPGSGKAFSPKGGIHTEEGHRFQLYLEVDGKNIKGRSYIHIRKDSILQMNLSGTLYNDNSIYLREVDPKLTEAQEKAVEEGVPRSHFSRKYQFIYKRSIWDPSLEGYWQEVTPLIFNYERERGRVKLEKKTTKA